MSLTLLQRPTPLLEFGGAIEHDGPIVTKAMPGHELVDLEDLGIFASLRGAEGNDDIDNLRGYNSAGDVITQTTDGRDLNAMWSEFQATIQIYNERRQRLIDLLTFPVVNVVEDVPQIGGTEFERASEFGEPVGQRSALTYWSMAYDFHWYDLATRFTWQYLAEATAQQVESLHQAALEADNRLLFRKVMEAIFDNRTRRADIRSHPFNVYPLYNGTAATPMDVEPPPFKGRTFTNKHSHYMVSGNVAVDSQDLDDMYDNIAEHGFGAETGTQFLLLVNPNEEKQIRRFRMNEVNNNGALASYDFIPAQGQPGMIVPNAEGLLGQRAPQTVSGLRLSGSYGWINVAIEDYIPAGYMVLLASGGAGNIQNLVGIREHANAQLRGLRLLRGNQQGYPLTDSYYNRGFGTGIRQRAGGVIMQVKSGGPDSYEPPQQYKNGGALR